jgi:hypothetical protein
MTAQLAAALGALERGFPQEALRLRDNLSTSRACRQRDHLDDALAAAGVKSRAELKLADKRLQDLLAKLLNEGKLEGTGYTSDDVDDMMSALDALPPVPPMTSKQRNGIRAMCDAKDWPFPAGMDDWTKSQASKWMEENDFRAWRDTHPVVA